MKKRSNLYREKHAILTREAAAVLLAIYDQCGCRAVRFPVLMEDAPRHTPANPFCLDPECPCRRPGDMVGEVNDQVAAGLLTTSEATAMIVGKSL